ncbi:hypothetical protein [Bacillus massilinigeriensis]|uniref:hypothetical protein n=1 Tax=Bacillus massilionigeriensis TaxID=1805475 RepID=UPI00096B2647|nr:hypothetical protein [Bacillus massilionigeriensis]
MPNLIPKAKGQKITYADIEQFPEKLTELFDGEFIFMESEKRAVLLTYLTSFGLRYLLDILPLESIKELEDLLSEMSEKD